MKLLKKKKGTVVDGLNKISIVSFLGNDLEISRDSLSGKMSMCLVKHCISYELLPNLQYPVHSNYKAEDGYELKIGDKVDLLAKLDEKYWAIKRLGDDSIPYVISDENLKKVLLTIGCNY